MKSLGIGMHSYGFHWKAGPFNDALSFLEYAHGLGAGGVQVSIGQRDAAYTRKLRDKCEEWAMYLEAQASLPPDDSAVARFSAEVQSAIAAGATVMRTAMLNGRRYETFNTAQEFEAFRARSWKSLTLAEPIAKKHGIRLAIENHKDWLISELLDIVRKISSEYVGICVDTGNSIALLEDPISVVEAYAPFAISTHVKDMGVAQYEHGFLLSEVPLGAGFLDLSRMIQALEHANPKLQWNLEMITRDPLEIPYLQDKYWVTLKSMPARQLAEAVAMVRAHEQALPRVSQLSEAEKLQAEDDNVRQSLAFFKSLNSSATKSNAPAARSP
jgi:sugar phosphate isomerase/epimerase